MKAIIERIIPYGIVIGFGACCALALIADQNTPKEPVEFPWAFWIIWAVLL